MRVKVDKLVVLSAMLVLGASILAHSLFFPSRASAGFQTLGVSSERTTGRDAP